MTVCCASKKQRDSATKQIPALSVAASSSCQLSVASYIDRLGRSMLAQVSLQIHAATGYNIRAFPPPNEELLLVVC